MSKEKRFIVNDVNCVQYRTPGLFQMKDSDSRISEFEVVTEVNPKIKTTRQRNEAGYSGLVTTGMNGQKYLVYSDWSATQL